MPFREAKLQKKLLISSMMWLDIEGHRAHFDIPDSSSTRNGYSLNVMIARYDCCPYPYVNLNFLFR